MITRTVPELLDGHVTLDVEGIDRINLNAYQPMLQTGGGVVIFQEASRSDGRVCGEFQILGQMPR